MKRKEDKVDLLKLLEAKTIEWMQKDMSTVDDKELRRWTLVAKVAIQVCRVKYKVNMSDEDLEELADKLSGRHIETLQHRRIKNHGR